MDAVRPEGDVSRAATGVDPAGGPGAASRPPDDGEVTPGRLRCAVEAAFPDLEVGEVTFLSGGWCNHVLDVGGRWVFRFPRHAGAVRSLFRERTLLPALAPLVPFDVPVPEHFCLASEHWPRPFSGARRLAGTDLRALTGRVGVRPGLARSLGRALRELWRVPPDALPAEGLACRGHEEWQGRYRDLKQRAEKEVLPGLAPDHASEARRRWERLEEILVGGGYELVPLHGDLFPEHVLCDPDEEVVLGLVDWEDAMLGDPAMEPSGILEVCDPAFTEGVLEAAGVAGDAGFRVRLELYRQTLPYYSIFHGSDTGDEGLLRSGRDELARSLEGS